jgi:phosphoribosylformimino-5-aminoimidazole carboxamide ribotide isomerase
MYRDDALPGGHVIALGPGNHDAALSALSAFPGGMQMGGGVTLENAEVYLEAGASHVIVTSYVFRDGRVDMARLDKLAATVETQRLVLDLSCRQRSGAYWVVTDRWQHFTDVRVTRDTLDALDIFGGNVPYREVVAWQRREEASTDSAISAKRLLSAQ